MLIFISIIIRIVIVDMITIDKYTRQPNILNNAPYDLISKMQLSQMGQNETIDVVVMYGNEFEDVNKYINSIQGTLYDLGYGFGIVTISVANSPQIFAYNKIQYAELPKSIFLSDSISNVVVCADKIQNEFKLTGNGVIVGFIDSGIDYTHNAFRNDDGSTRIEYIFDLSGVDTVYNKDQINDALKNSDPYSVVPVNDITEHGTHVAGIACAGGKIDKKYYGVAPESSIIMVKSGRGLFSLSTQVMKGIKFLIDKSKELNMPMVINMSLSTNDGAHNGSSLFEKYIDTISTVERVTTVISAGNEGDAAHHIGRVIDKETLVKFNVAEDETAIVINLYKSLLPDITIEIIAPTGATSGQIKVEQGYTSGVISRNRYQVYDTGPKPFDIIGEIGISLISEGNYILPGEWTIRITKDNEYQGNFDMWLPISEGLNRRTRFLEPTVYNTLGIPATVKSVISVGSYNNRTATVSPFSGRGKQNQSENIKPDIVAPGENISSSVPGGNFDIKTGTSMASPHVSGCAALMMQWGLLQGNDPFLFGERLKYYFIKGARRERLDIIYPDPSFGYGEICVYRSINLVIEDLKILLSNEPDLYRKKSEYNLGTLFIRIPN